MTAEEEKWAEKSEWTREGRESGSGLRRLRLCLEGRRPRAFPGPPALEAGAGDPTPPLIPTPRSSRSPPSSRPTPPAVQVPSRVLRDPAELFLPPGSSIYYVHVLAPPHRYLPLPRPAFYLSRPRSKLCLCCLTAFPSASDAPSFFSKSVPAIQLPPSSIPPPRFSAPPSLPKVQSGNGARGGGGGGEGRGGGGGQWSGKQDK